MLDTCGIHGRYMVGTCGIHGRYMVGTCWVHVGYMVGTCWVHVGYMVDTRGDMVTMMKKMEKFFLFFFLGVRKGIPFYSFSYYYVRIRRRSPGLQRIFKLFTW